MRGANVARVIARILMGVAFLFAGGSAFFVASPPMPGLVGQFNAAFSQSHYQLFIAVVQIVAGVLFIVKRYMVLAIVLYGAFMYNSLAFHITMMPPTVPVPLVFIGLLVFVAWPYRAVFAELFAARPVERVE